MRLIDNPFYILDVSTTDNRQTIISKAEEKSFFDDSTSCGEAQNTLLNIIKRTSAELSWFPGADKNKINEIREAINNDDVISLSGLTSIAKLNACIYNFGLEAQADVYETGYAVLELDEEFEQLDVTKITSIVNHDRAKAGIKEVSYSEVATEIEKVREYIRQTISERVQNFSDDQYAEFATLISEKCIADKSYDDGVVIDDIINEYEIWAQPILEEQEDDIRKDINKVTHIISSAIPEASLVEISKNYVSNILGQLKLWDVYAQPLQLRDTARGYANPNSQDLAHDIRELAILLYNEKGYLDLAIKITNTLKSVFAEMPEFVDKISNDQQVLQKNKVQRELERSRELKRQITAPQKPLNTTGSNHSGCLTSFICFIVIMLIMALISGLTQQCSSDSEIENTETIKITENNFEKYFTIETDAVFMDDVVKITYSIEPKSDEYAENDDSSDEITVEIGAVVSETGLYYGDPTYDKKYTVTLKKGKNYTAEGSFSIYYYEEDYMVYWLAEVTSCSGTIEE